jgi:hypothetical protein
MSHDRWGREVARPANSAAQCLIWGVIATLLGACAPGTPLGWTAGSADTAATAAELAAFSQPPTKTGATEAVYTPAAYSPVAQPASYQPSTSYQPSKGPLLDRSWLSGALGAPSWVRHEAPAEVWQYQGPSCTLDVYLYADEAGELKIAHSEARDDSAQPVGVADCVTALRGGHMQGPSS